MASENFKYAFSKVTASDSRIRTGGRSVCALILKQKSTPLAASSSSPINSAPVPPTFRNPSLFLSSYFDRLLRNGLLSVPSLSASISISILISRVLWSDVSLFFAQVVAQRVKEAEITEQDSLLLVRRSMNSSDLFLSLLSRVRLSGLLDLITDRGSVFSWSSLPQIGVSGCFIMLPWVCFLLGRESSLFHSKTRKRSSRSVDFSSSFSH